MQVAFCANCGKRTGHKRSIGVGTALGALVTGGASLLAVPAYGKRCVICGLTESEAAKTTPAPQTIAEAQQAAEDTAVDTAVGLKWLAIIGFVVAAIIFLFVRS